MRYLSQSGEIVMKYLIFFFIIFSTKAQINTLRFVTENAPPFQIVEDDKVTGGLAFDLLEVAQKKLNIDIEIEAYPWARAYSTAQGDANILIFSITRTEKRENLFKWIDTIYVLEDYLWALKSSSETKDKTTPIDLRKYRTGVQRDDQQYAYLKEWGLDENNGLVIVPTWDLAIKMLYANRLDFIMGSELMLIQRLKANGLDPEKIEKRIYLGKMGSGLFYAFSKNTSDSLVNVFKNTFAKMRKSGEYEEIKNKWLK